MAQVKHWIDWEKVKAKYGLVPDFEATDIIGMVPVFRIVDLGGLNPKIKYNFLPEAAQRESLAWVYRNGREYWVSTTHYHDEIHEILSAVNRGGEIVYRQETQPVTTQFGPYKTVHTAVKKLKELMVQNGET